MAERPLSPGTAELPPRRARGRHGLLAELFEHLPDPVYLIDPPSARIVYCNRAAQDHLGLSRDELLARSVLHLQDEPDDAGHWQRVAGAIRESGHHVYLGRHRHRAGHPLPVEVHSRPFRHRGREYFLAVARRLGADLPARAPHELLDRDARLRFALDETIDGLWDWRIRCREVYFSPQWRRLLGYEADESLPFAETWLRSVHSEDLRRVRHALREHLSGRRERFEVEYRLRNRNGHYLWVHDRGKVCERSHDGRPLRMVGMVNDITERKHLELELQRRASHDSLTGLLNRRESETILETQLQLCRRLGLNLSICLFDIDHFKRINDLLGHLTGDLVLQRVAELVGGSVRAADYLFRWGGEEFLLVCADTDAHAMCTLAEKLRRRLEGAEWPSVPGLEHITASFGVASYPECDSTHELLLTADTALYRAKSGGRNRVDSGSP